MSTQTKDALTELRDTLGKMGGQFKAVMPTQQHVDRFIRVVMTAVQANLDLLAADRTSFYSSCMKCAQDGLLPDGKQAVLKIYNQKQSDGSYAKVVQYEPMTEGMLIKLRNSGEIIGAPKVHVWHENDTEFRYELGDNERIVHVPALKNRGPIAGAYSIVKLKSGDTSREVMTIEEIDAIMQRTKSKDREGNIFGPWKTDKPEMCRKTVFKRHAKRLPKSTDLDNMINFDNEQNGLADPVAQEPKPAAQAGGQQAEPTVRKPPALAAVAQHGGTPMPQQKVSEKVVEGEAVTQQRPDGPPADII